MEEDHISVCICTFKRPESLKRLLDTLVSQVTDTSFSLEIIVVDNDVERSGEQVVQQFQSHKPTVAYDCEPVRSISLTRNRAIRNATGNLIALIDDDEWPVADWLVQLHRTLRSLGVDGVLGPVIPCCPDEAPSWLRKSGFLERPRLATGTAISSRDCRTGNVLLTRTLFPAGGLWFDPSFGRTGGEDGDFFRRHLGQGRRFVWCDEAAVFESVPAERWKASFHIKRYLRSGTVTGELMRSGHVRDRGLLAKNVLLLGGCGAIAPLAILLPTQHSVRFFQKAAYCCGIVTAYFGFSILRLRD